LAEGLLAGETGFDKLVAHLRPYSPEWAAGICDVPAATMRRSPSSTSEHACVGQTVEIEGKTLPYRPVAVTLGKTVNNGWGGYECCWARTPAGLPGRRTRGAGRHAGQPRLRLVRRCPSGWKAHNPGLTASWSTR